MTATSQILLACTLIGVLAGSFIDFGPIKFGDLWFILLPFGAISYGLFIIHFMLEKPSAQFDLDHKQASQPIKDSDVLH